MSASIKSVQEARVGDTITLAAGPQSASEPLPGYTEAKPMVFCGLFPCDSDQFPDLRDALERLQLNDAALAFEPEISSAMGFGFRCGFLGLLHMEIVQERLEREYDLDLITTAPSVVYHVKTNNGEILEIDNPAQLPGPDRRESIAEPYVKLDVCAEGVRGGDNGARCTAAGGIQGHAVRDGGSYAAGVRDAAGRGSDGLLRPAQVVLQGVRQ